MTMKNSSIPVITKFSEKSFELPDTPVTEMYRIFTKVKDNLHLFEDQKTFPSVLTDSEWDTLISNAFGIVAFLSAKGFLTKENAKVDPTVAAIIDFKETTQQVFQVLADVTTFKFEPYGFKDIDGQDKVAFGGIESSFNVILSVIIAANHGEFNNTELVTLPTVLALGIVDMLLTADAEASK